jgi:hypothetical protein
MKPTAIPSPSIAPCALAASCGQFKMKISMHEIYQLPLSSRKEVAPVGVATWAKGHIPPAA